MVRLPESKNHVQDGGVCSLGAFSSPGRAFRRFRRRPNPEVLVRCVACTSVRAGAGGATRKLGRPKRSMEDLHTRGASLRRIEKPARRKKPAQRRRHTPAASIHSSECIAKFQESFILPKSLLFPFIGSRPQKRCLFFFFKPWTSGRSWHVIGKVRRSVDGTLLNLLSTSYRAVLSDSWK